MLTLLIYFYGIVDRIISVASITAWITGIVGFIAYVIVRVIPAYKYDSEYDQEKGEVEKKNYVTLVKKIIWVHVFTTIISVAVPSSKVVACMYVLPQIASSKVIQQDLPEIYDMAIKSLKDTIKEATK